MKRWAKNLSVAMCLLIFVASVMLWVRSYWCTDEWGWEHCDAYEGVPFDYLAPPHESRCALSARGRVWVGRTFDTTTYSKHALSGWYYRAVGMDDFRLEGSSFRAAAGVWNIDNAIDGNYDGVVIP